MINKAATIRRCVKRITEVFSNKVENLHDFTKQDSVILNLQRACEASIDLAMHMISIHKLGVPQSSRDAFDLLQRNGMLQESIAVRMKAMVGFRNVAVHDYQALQIPILHSIITKHLDDFEQYIQQIIKL